MFIFFTSFKLNNYLSLFKTGLVNFKNSNARDFIWPIRSFELSKFFLMASLMFFILLNQNLIRALKDSFIMTLVGPEIISFIKLWCEMPAGILFVITYTKLCNIMTTEQVFRVVTVFFLSFFTIFAFILYPYQSFFHPDSDLVSYYIELNPHFKWFITLWGKWTFILFYVMGELWAIIIFTLLFWQLANKFIETEEAKRFYPFFNVFGQLNLLISGIIIYYFVQSKHCLYNLFSYLTDPTEIALKSITAVVVVIGCIILYLHYLIEKKVINIKNNSNKNNYKPEILKLSLRESMLMVIQSRYLWLICTLIASYNIAVNLVEGLWMSKVKSLHPTAQGFMSYQGNVLFWTGIFTLLCTFIGSVIIRRYGWFTTAIVTPLITMIAGASFFTLVINEDKLVTFFSIFSHLSPLMIMVFMGGLQNVLSKGAKYSLFDATKEMAYIPLDNEMKTKGKAAVDIIGTKIGKSVGAIIQFLLFTLIPSARYDDISGILATVFGMTILIWILAVKILAAEYALVLNKPS